MSTAALTWQRSDVCLTPSVLDVTALAAQVYDLTCRTDFDSPGFCLLNAGREIGSTSFRRAMVDLKRAMSKIHEAKTGSTLIYLSAARFDQQETTKPHLDGGPEECFLMLGYEPSDVDAELEIYDYAKCAFDMGLTSKEFMEQHNPMFSAGQDLLQPYVTRIPCFSATDYQIVCVNNSSAPFSVEQPRWQGTLHTATILTPDESKRRVINSTMIASAPLGTPDTVVQAALQEFIETAVVRRRGHDKPYLQDDR